jgi:hypothetical protein
MGVRFKLSETYRTEVNFAVFNEKGKKRKPQLHRIFKRKDKEAVKELVESSKKPGRDDSDLLREVMTGWVMTDLDTGEPVPFTPETLRGVLRDPGRRRAHDAALLRDRRRGTEKN